MNEYEAKIYEYFTQKDNFDMMVKVNEHADAVGAHLVRSFWEEASVQLNNELKKRKLKDYKAAISGDFEARWTKVWLYHSSWCSNNEPIVSVAFEDLHYGRQPYIGLSVNQDLKTHNTGKIREAIQALESLQAYKQDSNNYWAKWKWIPFSFASLQDLKLILPERRADAIEKVKEEAFELLNKVQDDIPSIVKGNKK